jgi:hypothetical protein
MKSLINEIAQNAADYAVAHYGLHLPKARQLKLWKRYYDSVLSALITYEEVDTARKVRARSVISEN